MEDRKYALALKVDDRDNVATIFANGITDGTAVRMTDKKGATELITVHGDGAGAVHLRKGFDLAA